jgi:hypothetical protein
MPLQGEAKREYQREYMRRKRLGLPTRIADEEIEYCSFCGKPADQVNVLVRAPEDAPHNAFICDSCVERATDAVAARRR